MLSFQFKVWLMLHILMSQGKSVGPCVTTAIWRYRKPFSQWQHSFLWKLRFHWLKFLRQHHVAVVRQGPVSPLLLHWRYCSFAINLTLLCCIYWTLFKPATKDTSKDTCRCSMISKASYDIYIYTYIYIYESSTGNAKQLKENTWNEPRNITLHRTVIYWSE